MKHTNRKETAQHRRNPKTLVANTLTQKHAQKKQNLLSLSASLLQHLRLTTRGLMWRHRVPRLRIAGTETVTILIRKRRRRS